MTVVLKWVGHVFSVRNVDRIEWSDVTATLVFNRGKRSMIVSIDDVYDVIW